MAEVSKRAAQVRKKQMLVLAGVGAAVAVVSIGASVWLQPAPRRDTPADQPKTKQLSLGGNSTEKEAWRVQSTAELDKMAKRLQELERRELDREAAAKRDEMQRQNRGDHPVVPPPEPPVNNKQSQQGLFSQVGTSGQVVPPPTRPVTTGTPQATEEVPAGPRIRSVSIDDTSSKPDSQQGSGDLVNSARKFGEEEARRRNERNGVVSAGADGKDRYSDDDPLSYNRAAGRSAETYLPAGTFVRATLMNGLDAPTGGQAQQNPYPVLLRLEDNAQLPNAVRANLKGCFVTGSGHGELSSERALIRLDRLTCVDEAGGAIDVAVRGYVSGEDGKTGMRGKLISKSGQVIANALFTGVLSGFGEAMRQGSITTQTAGATGTQTQTVNNALEYGVGTGVGKAMDRISQYYIKLADKLFPIVEVDGGRVVDVVLTRGVSIERK